MTPTGAERGVVTARIGHLTQEFVTAHDLGISGGAETGFILERDPDAVRTPDAAFVASDRVPETGVPASCWPFAPDLAVEVVSPSDRLADALDGGNVLPGFRSPVQQLFPPDRPSR